MLVVLFLLFAFYWLLLFVSFAQCLLTFVTHNSYLFVCFFNNRVVHFVVDNRFVLFSSFVNENDDENEMNFLFVCFACVCECVCVVKKGRTITTRQRNGVLFVLVSFAARLSMFNSSNSVWACVFLCESESSVIVVVLVR